MFSVSLIQLNLRFKTALFSREGLKVKVENAEVIYVASSRGFFVKNQWMSSRPMKLEWI